HDDNNEFNNNFNNDQDNDYNSEDNTKEKKQHSARTATMNYFLVELMISASISSEVDNIKLHNMFAHWIICCQRPFFLIEDPELTEIVQYLNPTAQLVKADMFKNTILALYNSGKEELK
ncbi:1335_t:CDS:2, partial [Dentiscutata heterogama]